MENSTDERLFRKVLVIDDNETDRYIATRILEKFKFAKEVVVKESAKKALEYLKSLENTLEDLPQFVFLDIRMPEMDGFGFLEAYNELPETIKSKCVIMMLSTSLDEEDHEKASKNIYVDRFMNKPIDKPKIENIKRDFLHLLL